MEDTVENNEIELDTSGSECPIPVLKARKLSQTLKHGDIVKVLTTDPLAEIDFKHYCEQSRFKYLGCQKIKGKYIIKYKFFSKN